MVVLPVPGPPAMTAKRRRSAVSAASRWRPGSNSRASRRRRRRQLAPREREQVGGDLALLAPVAVEVERAADQPQRPRVARLLADRDQRAGGEPLEPVAGVRPRQRAEVDGLVGVDGDGVADLLDVDEDVTEARPAHGERGGEEHRLVLFAGQLGQPAGDVQVGGREHARLVELAQGAGGARTRRGSLIRSPARR